MGTAYRDLHTRKLQVCTPIAPEDITEQFNVVTVTDM
jgi:hypothetical protein